MKGIRDFIRAITPFGLIERHRRQFQLSRLGLVPTIPVAEAVAACRYDLWPIELRNATKPWTLIDVGANCGDFTSAAASLAKLERVYAFEPQPQCWTELQCILDRIPNGVLHRAAVGAASGEIELICTANSKMASVLAPEPQVAAGYAEGDFTVTERTKVPVLRLDDVIPPGTKVGLMKIDVQGYELPVLEGAKVTLRSTFAILIEVNYVAHYQGGITFDALHEALRAYGFSTFGISAPYYGSKGPLWADALFVRCA
jgi:FkbM family methyltransferase